MRNAKIERLEFENRPHTYVTRITIDMTLEEQIDCPPAPRMAAIGDQWLELADECGNCIDYELQPEGVAMQLMRLAWVAAHAEAKAAQ